MTYDTLDAETCAFLLSAERLRRFRDGLLNGQRRTIGQEAIWAAFAETYDDLPSGAERRRWLMTVLEQLAKQGAIALPVRHGKQWDRTSEIVLPKVIAVVLQNCGVEEKSAWREFPWHPRLHWVFELRSLTNEQFAFLKRVHEGLVAGWFERTECFKYRSLQLTGDEKRLDTLHRGALFDTGRLSLEMLGCEPDTLPLATELVSCAPTLLIFENAAPFMLARSVLAKLVPPLIGRLAYGAGKQVLKAVRYFSMIEPAIAAIHYVGDLDAEGVAIAADLQRMSKFVPVRPATSFHRAMLEAAAELGAANGWPMKNDQPQGISESATSFLAEDVRCAVEKMIRDGRRIPEEVLSNAAVSRLLLAERGA